MIDLSTLKPNPDNPRLPMTDSQFKALKKSIQRDPEFMRIRPIVIDENRIILGGNRRYDACVALGMTEVEDDWVFDASGLTAAQRKRFIILDNSPKGISGDWDQDKLKEWDHSDLEEWGLEWGEALTLEENNAISAETTMINCPKCGFKWEK